MHITTNSKSLWLTTRRAMARYQGTGLIFGPDDASGVRSTHGSSWVCKISSNWRSCSALPRLSVVVVSAIAGRSLSLYPKDARSCSARLPLACLHRILNNVLQDVQSQEAHRCHTQPGCKLHVAVAHEGIEPATKHYPLPMLDTLHMPEYSTSGAASQYKNALYLELVQCTYLWPSMVLRAQIYASVMVLRISTALSSTWSPGCRTRCSLAAFIVCSRI